MTTERQLRPDDVRAFLSRDWSALRARKDAHWLDLAREQGGEATLAVAGALSDHVAAYAIDDADRRRVEDLEALVELKRRIDAASAALVRLREKKPAAAGPSRASAGRSPG